MAFSDIVASLKLVAQKTRKTAEARRAEINKRVGRESCEILKKVT